MTKTIGLARPLVKAGNDVAALRADALRDILTVGGVMAAGGVGARGLLGMGYMFGRKKPDLKRTLGPTVLSIPTPVYANPKDEQRAQLMAAKQAEATSRSGLPWYLPGITMAGIGGLAGGYKLMDYLMDKKRKADLQGEVDAARDEYQTAMLDQYDPATVGSADAMPDVPLPAKTMNPPAGVPKMPLKAAGLQADLDALAAEAEAYVEKTAMPDWLGKGVGAYGTLASLLALGSGGLAYKFTKDRSTNKLMEDAVKQRERERWNRRPPEIYAIPTPVRLSRQGALSPTGPQTVLPGV